MCCQLKGFNSNGGKASNWIHITLWWRPVPNTLLILFSQMSRTELLTCEELCGWPLEASGGGDLLLNIGVAS